MNKLLWIVPAAAVGCVSHYRQEPVVVKTASTSPATVAVVAPEPAPVAVVLPTSTRQNSQIYPAISHPDDVRVTDQIRHMLAADATGLYRNVRFEVDRGKVIIRGMVPTERDRLELQTRIAAMAGVRVIDNKVGLEPGGTP